MLKQQQNVPIICFHIGENGIIKNESSTKQNVLYIFNILLGVLKQYKVK